MSARENILKRIRSAQGRAGGEPTEAELDAIRDSMREHEIGPLPGVALPIDRLAQFRAECTRLGSTHADVAHMEEVPKEVARYLADQGLEKRAVAWPELAGSLDWQAASVVIETILASVILKERVDRRRWMGVACVAGGVYLLAL